MKNNILKGSILVILTILFVTCIISNVSAADNSTDLLSLSKDGITLNYPADWGNSEATSNYSIMSISKLDSIDSLGIGQININVEKKPIEGDFNTFVDNNYKSMKSDSNFQLISSGDVVVAGKDAIEYLYISTDTGIEREHKAVWFDGGDQVYVVMYSAPADQFEENLYIFEYILSNLQIA